MKGHKVLQEKYGESLEEEVLVKLKVNHKKISINQSNTKNLAMVKAAKILTTKISLTKNKFQTKIDNNL